MKKIKLMIIGKLNDLWIVLNKKGIISKGTAMTLIYKTTYFFGRKRKERK